MNTLNPRLVPCLANSINKSAPHSSSFPRRQTGIGLAFLSMYQGQSAKVINAGQSSNLLKDSDCRLLKKVSEARLAENRGAEAYLDSTLERGD